MHAQWHSINDRSSGFQNVFILNFIGAKMMEVVVTTGAIILAKLQSSHHHQQANVQLFTGQMPFFLPNEQRQSTEGNTASVLLLLSCAKSHMLSASRRQPHLLHVSAVDCRQTWSMDKS